ncbi:MAG TPA: dephospho-CoA kinase [Flavobacterium sp.]|nr:dephospho-CoA kinase [Flavobacterium sp.]
MKFSIIIPVYNRPDEIKELLDSLVVSDYKKEYEVVIVEDGSTIDSKEVVRQFSNQLNISYYFKENSGPGDSRNFGMKKAKGDYFIIFDSDCIIPKEYLNEIEKELTRECVDCFGGPDRALASFSKIQKAINFAMTSFLTTGGIRGGSEKLNKFQPRSFNMGISKKAYEASNGFGNIHPGEDPDLSIRLWKLGFKTRLFSNAYVYHKRRIDWQKFSFQVNKFGKARPILNHWYPEYSKPTFWLPSLFVIGLFASFLSLLLLFDWPLKIYFLYFVIIFVVSSIQNKNPLIGFYSMIAVWKQFTGYGMGFLESYWKIKILKRKPEVAFPELFFKLPNQTEVVESFTTTSKPIVSEESKDVPVSNPIATPIVEVNSTPKSIETKKNVIKTKIIGLTGGIGSGKTTIATYIQSKAIPVYISDTEAKKVMEQPEIIAKINATFNEDITTNSVLDRQKLASIVFGNPEKLKQLNAIVHPAVKIHFDNWVKQNQNKPIIVKEAAILFESGSYKDCDSVISVIAPLETRIERVIQRDNTTRDKVLQRINNQITDEERISKSDYIIKNESLEEAKKQTDQILNLLENN